MANRHTTTLPAAYIWAERNEFTPDWAADDDERAAIQRYRYRTDARAERITQADIETLLERMPAALSHIERGIETPANGDRWSDAGKDARVPKAPLDVSQLTQLHQGSGSLASTVQEYALLEYDSGVTGAIQRYRQPLDERLEGGRSLAFEADRAWTDDSGNYPNHYLAGDILSPTAVGAGDDGDRVIPQSVEEGDWLVLTELNMAASPPRVRRLGDRAYIRNSMVVTVEAVDTETGRIRVNCMNTSRWLQTDVPCATWHRSPEVLDDPPRGDPPVPEPDYYTTHLQAGRSYVLDEFADSITNIRAFPALTGAANAPPGNSGNSLYDHLQDLYNR